MIYIRQRGIFYETDSDPNSEGYAMIKVDSIIPYLSENIYIDSGVTLNDLFIILERDERIVNIIFGSDMDHNPLRPYFDEIQKDCIPEGKEELECIECSWVADQFDYRKFYEKYKDDKKFKKSKDNPLRKPNEDDVNEIEIYVDVHGWGKSEEDEVITEGEEELPLYTSFGIQFTPLYRLKHLPIKLNKSFVLREGYDEGEKIVEGERSFTVFEVFGAILAEVTFAGLPEDRDDQWKNIVDGVDEYRDVLDEEDEEDEEDDCEN